MGAGEGAGKRGPRELMAGVALFRKCQPSAGHGSPDGCWGKQLREDASLGQGHGPGESPSWESHSAAHLLLAKHLQYA